MSTKKKNYINFREKKTQHLKLKGNILEVSLLKQMTGIHRELSSEKLYNKISKEAM